MASDSTRYTTDSTRTVAAQEDLTLAVNAFVEASARAQSGNEEAEKERRQHLRTIQARYWRIMYSILSSRLARSRHALEFSEDERLLIDMGLVDAKMLGRDSVEQERVLLEELNTKGIGSVQYFSEWLMSRSQQLQVEHTLARRGGKDDYVSTLAENRKRVLDRLGDYFVGLPGVPLEVSESMRSGELDSALITTGIGLLRDSKRRDLMRRHNLWMLREQVLTKARARVGSQSALKLFEILNEIYARDWREHYDEYLRSSAGDTDTTAYATGATSVSHTGNDVVMIEARQMRMRIVLESAINGNPRPDTVLHAQTPRLTKGSVADFLRLPQTFDRGLVELPPMVIVPGTGRGFFAWEIGSVILSIRPLVGVDDSVATALAWQRILDDRQNRGGVLRAAYERAFPGGVFQNDFPADYRAWLCRLTKGDVSAMNPDHRAFFREHIGPEVSGPMLPSNLRNIGPQTIEAICRRLEKQIAGSDTDVNLHRRLACLYWQQGNLEAASLQFTAAMKVAPGDGETLFCAGMFLRSRDDVEAANDCFRFGAERSPDTLWGIYCRDALDNLL